MSNPDNQFFRDEYLLIQDQKEDYERRSLTIKGWISAASIAAIALGMDPDKNPSGKIWVVIALVSLCMWYLEGRWKTFQYAHRDRIKIIEAYFRDSSAAPIEKSAPFQIYAQWYKSYKSTFSLKHLLFVMFQDFVFIPYLPIILICFYFYFFTYVEN